MRLFSITRAPTEEFLMLLDANWCISNWSIIMEEELDDNWIHSNKLWVKISRSIKILRTGWNGIARWFRGAPLLLGFRDRGLSLSIFFWALFWLPTNYYRKITDWPISSSKSKSSFSLSWRKTGSGSGIATIRQHTLLYKSVLKLLRHTNQT